MSYLEKYYNEFKDYERFVEVFLIENALKTTI